MTQSIVGKYYYTLPINSYFLEAFLRNRVSDESGMMQLFFIKHCPAAGGTWSPLTLLWERTRLSQMKQKRQGYLLKLSVYLFLIQDRKEVRKVRNVTILINNPDILLGGRFCDIPDVDREKILRLNFLSQV